MEVKDIRDCVVVKVRTLCTWPYEGGGGRNWVLGHDQGENMWLA